jgi:hypothetical protein
VSFQLFPITYLFFRRISIANAVALARISGAGTEKDALMQPAMKHRGTFQRVIPQFQLLILRRHSFHVAVE